MSLTKRKKQITFVTDSVDYDVLDNAVVKGALAELKYGESSAGNIVLIEADLAGDGLKKLFFDIRTSADTVITIDGGIAETTIDKIYSTGDFVNQPVKSIILATNALTVKMVINKL